MIGRRRAHKGIVRNVQLFRQVAKLLRHLGTKLQRFHSLEFRRRLDLETVFVRPRLKVNVATVETVKAGEDVASDGRVGVANVGFVIDVVDGCGDLYRLACAQQAGKRALPAGGGKATGAEDHGEDNPNQKRLGVCKEHVEEL